MPATLCAGSGCRTTENPARWTIPEHLLRSGISQLPSELVCKASGLFLIEEPIGADTLLEKETFLVDPYDKRGTQSGRLYKLYHISVCVGGRHVYSERNDL